MNAPEIVQSRLWRDLLPPGVIAFETSDFRHSSSLFAEERLAVAKAVASRVEEFAAGRACARRALAALGHVPGPLSRGADRAPLWPEGVVGSITHINGYGAAAVAPRAAFAGIGIDAERVGLLDSDHERHICTAGEREQLAALDPIRRAETLTIIFSAKEAFFKCQHATGTELHEFGDVDVQVGDGGFRIKPRRSYSLPGTFDGRYAVTHGIVTAGIAFHT